MQLLCLQTEVFEAILEIARHGLVLYMRATRPMIDAA
jgi:hypothetical protein